MITIKDIIEKLKEIKRRHLTLTNKSTDVDNVVDVEIKTTESKMEKLASEDALEGENLPDYFNACFPDVLKMFQDEGYVPETFDGANIVFNAILDLDKQTEIKTQYAKSSLKPNELTEVKINKNNFYIGYQSKIWKNLSVKERAQIVKWHFDHKKEQMRDKNLSLRLIIPKDEAYDHDMYGLFNSEENYVYITPFLLFQDYPLRLEHTIEHEFEHVKQFKLINYIDIHKPEKMNIYEKYIHDRADQDYISIPNATHSQYELLYFGDPMEQVANIRAIKNIEKYMADPNCQDIFDQSEKRLFKHFKNGTYYESCVFTPSQAKEQLDLTDVEFEQYKEDKKFIKQMPKICKLVLLRDLYLGELDDKMNDLYDLEKQIKTTQKQLKKDEQNVELKEKFESSAKALFELKEKIGLLNKKCDKINDYLQKIVKNETFSIEAKFFDELNLAE